MKEQDDKAQPCADDARSGDGARAPFRVYVAATSSGPESARVARVVELLRSNGFEVTSTWANTIAAVGEANPRGASATDRRIWAIQCLNEIDAADLVLVLVPELPTTTRGAWLEAGYAYSNHKHVVFAGDSHQSVFCALGIECMTDEGALHVLAAIRRTGVAG